MDFMLKIKNINNLEDYINANLLKKSPSISVIAVKNDSIVYDKSFGYVDIDKKNKTMNNSLYKIWSMTKTITAIGVFNLINNNKIDINTPIKEYLPYLNFKYQSKSCDITIKHLLNHSSGIKNNIPEVISWIYFEGDIFPNQTEFLKSIISNYSNLRFYPGEKCYYSNVNYMILGALIEKITSIRYEDYILKFVLKPLGMNETFFDIPQNPNIVAGTHPFFSVETFIMPFLIKGVLFKMKLRDKKLFFDIYYPKSTPPSGLISSSLDIAKLMLNIINEHPLIPKDMIDNNIGIKENIKYGFGFKIAKNKQFIFHDGKSPGFGSSYRIYQSDKVGISILTNNMYFDCEGLLDFFYTNLFRG